jgi:phosphate transport system substrate-binding protein
MKMKISRRRALALVVATCALTVVAPVVASASTVITMSGSTAEQPLLQLLAQKYAQLYPRRATFKIAGGGASVGISDVAAGNVDLGDLSRDPTSSDPKGLNWYPIARYFVCTVTNKSNTLANLTQAQLQAIFTGKVRDWSQVPGATATGTIDLISRTSTAGLLTTFQTLLLGGKTVSSIAAQEPSEGLMQQQVKSDKNAIGFLSDYYALEGVNAVGFNGVGCSLPNALSGQYTGVAKFYEVTKGPKSGAAGQFISWILHSNAALKIIKTSWLPLTSS